VALVTIAAMPSFTRPALDALGDRKGRVKMSRIIERIPAHYDTIEVPFGRIYQWHQAHLTLECDCGEILTFSGSSAITTYCRCGAQYAALVNDIHYREEHLLGVEEVHPWHYDLQSKEDQHLRDEAAYPEDSPWRYNDVTAGLDDEERWKKA
jgi:hypothetical protein